MQYTLKATIGLPNYSNLQPEITLDGENLEELHSTAIAHIAEVWAKYGEKPLRSSEAIVGPSRGILVDTFTGEQIIWDAEGHKYHSKDGVPLMSGSAYADSVSPKFDKATILPKTAKSWGVDESDLDNMWKLQADVSNGYGTSIHAALDIWHKYSTVGDSIMKTKELDQNYALPKNRHIADIVLAFNEKYGANALGEVMVSDVANHRAGQIDRLEILDKDKKVCRIGDYKTNNDLDDKKIKKYQHQLSFYAHILKNKGWNVEGLDIYHYNGDTWEKIALDVLDLVV